MIPLDRFYLNITLSHQELNTEDPANPVLPGCYKLSKRLLRSWDGSRNTIMTTPSIKILSYKTQRSARVSLHKHQNA